MNGEFEERELKYLGSQSRQALQQSMISSIKTLSTLKKRGFKIGPLKFRSEYNVVNLKQFKISYRIYEKEVSIQGIFRRLKVRGLHQIPKNAEFANAKLLKTPDGYHLKVTCFFEKETLKKIENEVGIDFGCSTSFILSTGEKINYTVEEPERLKRLQRKLKFLKKGSNNRKKLVNALKREYQKMMNKKNDVANKIVHRLLTENDLIAIQDEQLNAWKEDHHGKAVQHSVLGRVKSKLRNSEKVYVVSKWEATTQTCSNCGHKQEMPEKVRVYDCPECGLHLDRDVNAAKNILKIVKSKFTSQEKLLYNNMKLVPMECREVRACAMQEAATL